MHAKDAPGAVETEMFDLDDLPPLLLESPIDLTSNTPLACSLRRILDEESDGISAFNSAVVGLDR